MSVPQPVTDIVTALEAARLSLPAGWTLGYEIPHDASADAEIKARRYSAPQLGVARLGSALPNQLGGGGLQHVLLELIAPSGARRYRWAPLTPAPVWGNLATAMQNALAAQSGGIATMLPDGSVTTP